MPAALVLLVFAVGYGSYFLIANSEKLHNFSISLFEKKRTDLVWVLFQRCVGFICLGILPGALVLSLSDSSLISVGLRFHFSLSSLLSTLAAGVCVVVFIFLFSKRPRNDLRTPQIRLTRWDLPVVLLNAGSWMIYLLAYEFLFRGIVFFSFLESLGFVPAMAITTVLYVVVHIPKGAGETLGALPFGLLLCLITWEAGTIWPAFFLHLILALSFDFFSLRAENSDEQD